jgi:hypothetical protein
MDRTAILSEPLPASICCNSNAQQTRVSVFNNIDHEEPRNLGSASSDLSNSTFKVEVVNGLRNVDVNLDAR